MSIELTAYQIRPIDGWVLEPATRRRQWMEQTQNKGATRCLPLTMANHAGWIVRCPVRFKATWNGKTEPAATTIEFPEQEKTYAPQISKYFGSGIITFSFPWLFRTSEPYGLWVHGPSNFWINDAAPLEGIVETNWAPYTFTMNWKLTKPRTSVWFRQGDPICMLTPFPLNMLDQVQTKFATLESDPDLQSAFMLWVQMRTAQNQRSSATGNQTFALDYIRGVDAYGDKENRHRTQFKPNLFQGSGGGPSSKEID